VRSHLSRPSLLLLIAALTCCVSSHAQDRSAQLHVSTAAGATTFHIGERIALQLDFTAPPDAHLVMSTASYDRSGRMSYETFEISPSSGSSDPLASYFNGFLTSMGGMFGVAPLSLKPNTMHLDLNEWVRFDSPGDYTVTVHSNRVLTPGKPPFGNRDHAITSNAIKLHVIAATPEWQKATLAAALQTLSTLKPGPPAPLSPDVTAAIADIRFLGSAESIPVLVAGLSDEQSPRAFPFGFGLIGLPPSLHDLAIRSLRQRIDDADVPITSWLLSALAALETPPTASPEQGFKTRSAAYDQAIRLAIAALPLKTAKAGAVTADMLLRSYTGSLTSDDKAAIAHALASAFTELPEQNQEILLDWHWNVLRSAITPQTLQQIASLPVKDAGSNMTPTFERVSLKSAALHRLYELDPQAAKELAYSQIGSAEPSLTAARLWFLPSEPQPYLETIWAQALLDPSPDTNPEILAALMTRFGTGAFASHVAAKVRASLDEQACAPQAAMLAYVIKFAPDQGGPLLHDALKARGDTGCYHILFGDLSRYTTTVTLTDAAIETINDPDPDTAADALRYLTVYGDKRPQQAILTRYIAWTDEWSSKSAELEPTMPFTPSPNWPQRELGENLGRALLVNQGWITDDRLRAEVLKRCVGEQMCRTLQQISTTPGPPYQVILYQMGSGGVSIHVGPYDIPNLDLLKNKLSQYPQGTTFTLIPPDSSADSQRLEQQVQSAFDEAQLPLIKKP
jgi:hypothetical protein